MSRIKHEKIIEEFPWVREVHRDAFAAAPVTRVNVKRFDTKDLDLTAVTTYYDGPPIYQLRVCLAVVYEHGIMTRFDQLGYEHGERRLWLFKIPYERYYPESVCSGVQRFTAATHAVSLTHFGELVIYKPPEKGKTLHQWYLEQVARVHQQVREELEAL